MNKKLAQARGLEEYLHSKVASCNCSDLFSPPTALYELSMGTDEISNKPRAKGK